MVQPVVLILPGFIQFRPSALANVAWENEYGFYTYTANQLIRLYVRIDQHIDTAVMQHQPEQVVLVAHSLGCSHHCALGTRTCANRAIKGAFLVVPSDT